MTHKNRPSLGDTKVDRKGYIRVWMPGWELENRLVMGLERGDQRVSHHRNDDKLDNDPSNLEVLTRSEHARVHNERGTVVKTGEADLAGSSTVPVSAPSEVKPRGRGPGRPWVKGQSGNKSGRSKNHVNLTALLRKEISKDPGWIVTTLIAMARSGNLSAIVQILNRLEGLPHQTISFDLKKEAEKVAAAEGLDAGELQREAEAILAAARRDTT